MPTLEAFAVQPQAVQISAKQCKEVTTNLVAFMLNHAALVSNAFGLSNAFWFVNGCTWYVCSEICFSELCSVNCT